MKGTFPFLSHKIIVVHRHQSEDSLSLNHTVVFNHQNEHSPSSDHIVEHNHQNEHSPSSDHIVEYNHQNEHFPSLPTSILVHSYKKRTIPIPRSYCRKHRHLSEHSPNPAIVGHTSTRTLHVTI